MAEEGAAIEKLSHITEPISQNLAHDQSELDSQDDLRSRVAIYQSTKSDHGNIYNNESDCYTSESALNSQSQSFPVECESRSQTVQHSLTPYACEDDLVLTQNNVTLPEPLSQAHTHSSTMIIINTPLDDNKLKVSSVDPDNTF